MPNDKHHIDNKHIDKERQSPLDQRVAAIESALAPLTATVKFIKKRKGVLGTVAVLLVTAAIGFGPRYLDHWDDGLNAKVDKELNKPQGVIEKLNGIQKTADELKTTLNALQPFIQDLVRREFESAAKLPPSALGQRLSALNDLLAVAKDQNAKVDPKDVATISYNLGRVSEQETKYWPVVGQMITYRSLDVASPLPAQNVIDCIYTTPETTNPTVSFNLGGTPKQLTTKVAAFSNCRITLDSSQDGQHVREMLTKGVSVIFCNRCLVVYRGGPISIPFASTNRVVDTEEKVGLSVSGNVLQFQECVFDFSVGAEPADQVKELTKLILSQATTTIRVPVASGS